MSLTDQLNKIKRLQQEIEGAWFGPLVLVLVAAGAFGLGRWSKIEELRPAVTIEQAKTEIASAKTDNPELGKFVGSKSGTKYHLPWCSGAARIKEENKVWFDSKEEAEGRGYTPAVNCPGL